ASCRAARAWHERRDDPGRHRRALPQHGAELPMNQGSVTVYVPTPWRRLTGGAAHVPVDIEPGATDLAGLVARIDARHPGLKGEIWDGDDFRNYVNVYLNGEEVRAM